MQLQTNLVRRKSHFYFRSRIPCDLKSHYCKNEILISLKTCDRRIAEYELAKIKVKLYAEFARLRGDDFGIELKPNTNHQSKDATVSNVANSENTVSNVFNDINTFSHASDSTNTASNVVNSDNTVENVINGINTVNNVSDSANTVSNVLNTSNVTYSGNTVQNVVNGINTFSDTGHTIEHLIDYWTSQSTPIIQ
jgi:hypothetical protein